MGYDIITVSFCAQYFADFEVPGSDGTKTYVVSLSGGEGPAFCKVKGTDEVCMGWKFSKEPRECRHIKQVWKEACLANPQWKDPGPGTLKPVAYHNQSMHITGDKCVGCGGPTIPVRIAV